jgi:hypothetical protein
MCATAMCAIAKEAVRHSDGHAVGLSTRPTRNGASQDMRRRKWRLITCTHWGYVLAINALTAGWFPLLRITHAASV